LPTTMGATTVGSFAVDLKAAFDVSGSFHVTTVDGSPPRDTGPPITSPNNLDLAGTLKDSLADSGAVAAMGFCMLGSIQPWRKYRCVVTKALTLESPASKMRFSGRGSNASARRLEVESLKLAAVPGGIHNKL